MVFKFFLHIHFVKNVLVCIKEIIKKKLPWQYAKLHLIM